MALDNPWLPGATDVEGEPPPWSVLMQRFVDNGLSDAHVWLPAIVTLVKTNNRVDLQPLLLRRYKYGVVPLPLPVIQDCLVNIPRGKTWAISMPVAIGDTGIALFCDRSLDVWKQSAGVIPVDPLDDRMHHLSDAIFIPGCYPFLNPVPPPAGTSPLDIVFQNGIAAFNVQPTGTFMMGNGALETFALLVQTLTELTSLATQLGTTFTALATAGATDSVIPATTAAFTAAAAAFAPFVAALTTLTASFTALQGEPGA